MKICFQNAGISQEIDAMLVKKIDNLVRGGVSDVDELFNDELNCLMMKTCQIRPMLSLSKNH